MKIKSSYNLLISIIAFIVFGGTFFSTVHNPIGIRYISEISIVLSIVIILYRLLSPTRITRMEIALILLPLIAIFYSSAMSFLKYGQPLHYGLIEDRRMLQIYFYFPLFSILRRLDKPKDALSALQIAAVLITVLAFGVEMGLIPALNEGPVGQYRANRVSISNGLLMFGFLSAVLSFGRPKIITAVIILSYMLLVSLTRQIVIASMLSIALALILTSLSKNYSSPILLFFSALFTLLSSTFLSIFGILDLNIFSIYLDLLSTDYLESSARYYTINNIIQDWSVFGSGALSLIWNGGFSSIYSEYFFLADVGVFGTLHRFGIFSIVIITITFVTIFKRASKLYSLRSEAFMVILAWAFSFLVLLPVAVPFEYRGNLLAIFFAVSNVFLVPSNAEPGPLNVSTHAVKYARRSSS